jgi:hypothetical protein
VHLAIEFRQRHYFWNFFAALECSSPEEELQSAGTIGQNHQRTKSVTVCGVKGKTLNLQGYEEYLF